jgi:hypothetical protein
MPRRPSRAQVIWAIVMTSVMVVGVAAWMIGAGRDQGDASTAPEHAVLADPTTTSAPAPSPSTSAPPQTCATVKHRFKPQTITVAGVTKRASVVTPPRDQHGVPGTPPISTRGKTLFAWDRAQGIRPGDPAGNVLLNAHTWPDGTALGNRLLAGLHKGDRIVVRGANAHLCYRVTERVEVAADARFPRYYDKAGPPQLAILVCSGRRLGPGVWTKRTIWFASPSV